MSSPRYSWLASSSPLQPTQQHADQNQVQKDLDMDADSDSLSSVLSSGRSSPPASQRESSLIDEHADEGLGIVSNTDEDSQDSTALPSRPNKFRGSASTWRNRTAPVRELAASLDTLQAKDLSIHLYNSFKLRQRNRRHEIGRPTKPSRDSSTAAEESKWAPPQSWTAWPLPPAVVPREHDEMRWEEDAAFRKPRHSSPRRPSHFLREMLVAQVLRIAKERFYQRQREMDAAAREQDARGSESVHSSRSSPDQHDKAYGQKPVVMADDLKASKILRSTVQHMISELDKLLTGLHRARSAYLSDGDSSDESPDQERERSRSRGRPRKKKEEQIKSSEATESSHDTPSHQSSDSDTSNPTSKHSRGQPKMQRAKSSSLRSRKLNSRRRKERLGLRNWNDVVAIASMIGWRQSVVGKATTRCAAIFEESIMFRVLEEGKPLHAEQLYSPNAPAPGPVSLGGHGHSQSEILRARDQSDDDEMVGAVHVDGFLKPIERKKSWIYPRYKKSKRRLSSHESEDEV